MVCISVGIVFLQGQAPLRETLAAGMVLLSFWEDGRMMVDPFCGSGTIAIEAALIGRNIAPGINRRFASDDWDMVGDEIWENALTERVMFRRRNWKLRLRVMILMARFWTWLDIIRSWRVLREIFTGRKGR